MRTTNLNDTCNVVEKIVNGRKLDDVFHRAVLLALQQKETLFNEMARYHYGLCRIVLNAQEKEETTHPSIEQLVVSYVDHLEVANDLKIVDEDLDSINI